MSTEQKALSTKGRESSAFHTSQEMLTAIMASPYERQNLLSDQESDGSITQEPDVAPQDAINRLDIDNPKARQAYVDSIKLLVAKLVDGGEEVSLVWQDQAACRLADPELFFPERESGYPAKTAKMICDICPVRERCLQEAIAGKEFGIWGGETTSRRKSLAANKKD